MVGLVAHADGGWWHVVGGAVGTWWVGLMAHGGWG